MAASSIAWDHQVDERFGVITNKLKEYTDFAQKDVPGLVELLDDYLAPDVTVTNVEFNQRLLRVFKDSETDGTYSELLGKYTPEEQQQIGDFVQGAKKPQGVDEKGEFFLGPSLGCVEELSKLEEAECIVHITPKTINYITPSPLAGISSDEVSPASIKELQSGVKHGNWFARAVHKLAACFTEAQEDDESIKIYKHAEFQNWGLNITNKPDLTCVPNSTAGICSIVKFAKAHDMSVRCSGYRHSWSPIFGRSGQILISMLELKTVNILPNTTSLPLTEPKPTELESIDVVPGKPRTPGNSLVRIGCATTNERLRRWCIANNRVTIPLNVIMVEITLGGSNAPICHGAGRRHQTLSDLVRKLEYVDANGELRSVDKPEHLLAASGCFGLMGVVTHITLEFPPMTYALLDPKKMPVIQAVPPPPEMDDKDIPQALLRYWSPLSSVEKQKCQAEFERRATDDYYSEWFWFPFSDFAWVNTWNDTKDPKGVESFPSNTAIWISFGQTFLMNVLQNTKLLDSLVDVTGLSEAAVTLISRVAMKSLPEDPVKTFLPDALHFQRAIQNVRVRDVEVEMLLVAKRGGGSPEGTIDFAPVQQAWWDAILLVYSWDTTAMKMPLEMRIMGDSNVIMAPQRGNALGTCSIEVLTLHSAGKEWPPFAQAVLDKWMALKDPNTGERLKTRPHWAKEWYNFDVDGKPWMERLKSHDYKEERMIFLETLEDIGKGAGWTLSDLKKRFSNDFFDVFFFDQVV